MIQYDTNNPPFTGGLEEFKTLPFTYTLPIYIIVIVYSDFYTASDASAFFDRVILRYLWWSLIFHPVIVIVALDRFPEYSFYSVTIILTVRFLQ